MKFFLFFIIFFSLKLIKNEFLEFIDSSIDADCVEIKKAHPEMKIVCQDNTLPIASHSETDQKINNKKENSNEKTHKPQETFDSLTSIDSILNEENNLIKNTPDKTEKKNEISMENHENIEKKPDASLDFNSIISAENDVITKLKNLDFTTKSTSLSDNIPTQNEEKIKDNYKKDNDAGKLGGLDPEMDSLLNKKNFLNIDLEDNNAKNDKSKNINSKKNIDIDENKAHLQKINQNLTNKIEKRAVENQEKNNFLGNINDENKSMSKKLNNIKENSSQNFIFKEKSNDFFPNDVSSQQLRIDNIEKQQKNLEISFENLAKSINNKLKPDLFMSEIKENISENMKNIKKLIISEQNKEKNEEIIQSITDIANNQKNIQKQMEELNQNQKNLLKFLQTRFLDKKEKENDLSGFMRLKATSSLEENDTNEEETKKEPLQAPSIDYKQKLIDLFDLIKKELK